MKRATKSKKAQRGKQKEGSAFRAASTAFAPRLAPRVPFRHPRRVPSPKRDTSKPAGEAESRSARRSTKSAPRPASASCVPPDSGWLEGGRSAAGSVRRLRRPRRPPERAPHVSLLLVPRQNSRAASERRRRKPQRPRVHRRLLFGLGAAFLPSAAPPHATLAPQRPLAPSCALRRQRGEMWRPSGARSAPVAPARGDGGPAARCSCCAAVASRTFGNACAQCCAENDASAGTPHTLPACEPRPSRQCSLATSCARKARQSSPDCSATAAWRSGRQRGVAPRARARPRHTRGGLATALILRACDCAPSAPPGGEE